jgi:hypothetical protein
MSESAVPGLWARRGRQRGEVWRDPTGTTASRCRTCGHTFCETTGSVFYRLRSQREDILEALRSFAQGDHISHVARQMRVNVHTVSDWLTKAFSASGQDVGEELGLTSQQMEDLRTRFAQLRRRRSAAGGQADDS